MYNIVFVCYGNICRSPMAEMIFKDLVYLNNKRYLFTCSSRSTSVEELGNGIYYKAKKILEVHNVHIEKHIARQFKKEDYNKYDYIIIFDNINKKDILNIVKEDPQNKIHFLLDFCNSQNTIEDPWYTNEFEKCYEEINKGCQALFKYLINKEKNNEI